MASNILIGWFIRVRSSFLCVMRDDACVDDWNTPASSASLNSAFSFASASGPATPSDYNPSYPDHSTYTNPSGQSYIFPTTSHPHQQTKEDPYAAQYAMQAQQQQTQGPLSVHPPTANEGEARAFAEYVHAHGLPMAQAQLAMNGGVIQVVSPVDGFTYGADGSVFVILLFFAVAMTSNAWRLTR